MSGYGDVTKPASATARATSRKSTDDVSVRPCVTTGSPSAPSQQSISTQRQPISSWRRYMSTDDRDVSWLPSRYELCDELIR